SGADARCRRFRRAGHAGGAVRRRGGRRARTGTDVRSGPTRLHPSQLVGGTHDPSLRARRRGGGMSAPLVSIGVPVYNGDAVLERALDALCAKDYEHLEIIVSDNASTDNTPKIGRAAAERDERVLYLSTDVNRGAAWNFSRLVHVAQGPYFKWAAADDLCRPEFVSTCVAVLEADPSAVLCYPRTSLIDEDDNVVDDFDDDLAYADESPIRRLGRVCRHGGEYHAVFGVIRTDALRDTGLLGAFVAADIVTLAELSLRGRFCEHPDRLFLRRYHAGTSVIANPDARSRARW